MRKNFIGMFSILFLSLFLIACSHVSTKRFQSWEELNKFCQNPDNRCPQDLCRSIAVGGPGGGEAQRGCVAIECSLYTPSECPQAGCEVIKNKKGEKICWRRNFPFVE